MFLGKFLIHCLRDEPEESFGLFVSPSETVITSLSRLPTGVLFADSYLADFNPGNSLINYVLSSPNGDPPAESRVVVVTQQRIILQDETWAEVASRTRPYVCEANGYTSFEIRICQLVPHTPGYHLRITRWTNTKRSLVRRATKCLR